MKRFLDSPEGIRLFMGWAARGGVVLNEFHEAIAKKHGVPVPKELVISRSIS